MSKALRRLAALTLVGGVLVAPGMAPMAAAGDRPTEFQFSSAAYQAQEPTGSTTTATITLTRLNLKGQASVVVTSTDGTGTAGSDYTAVDSTVKFGTKVAVKTFTVTLLPDAANEPNETFTLSVQPAPGSTSAVQIGTPSTAAFTIVSDRDSDGLSDQDEVDTYGTDPDDPDTDRDGLTDGDEVNIHNTDPTFADIDNDGLNDSEEIDAAPTHRIPTPTTLPERPHGVPGPDHGPQRRGHRRRRPG